MSEMMIKGIYRDRLLDAAGRELFDSGWRNNLIVMNCRKLLAGFMKNDTALGIRSLQVGRGDPAWDVTPPAAPDPVTTTQLVDASPFAILHTDLTLQYLDASDQIVAGPTNRIEIVATLGNNQPPVAPPATVFPLREFGLFGELNGTTFMIDYIRHPLIEKDVAVTLERRVRLIF
ncbi:MAG: hypothetical protein ACREOI_29630 [bacterium]